MRKTEATAQIKRIRWGTVSDDGWRRRSVVHVTSNKNVLAGPGTVTDPHLGTSLGTYRCAHCFNSSEFCTGHFGHIDLVLPVINYTFHDHVFQIVRSFCYNCSMLLASERKVTDTLRLPPEKRLSAIAPDPKREHTCQHCGFIQPKYEWISSSNMIKAHFDERCPGTWTPRDLFDSLAFVGEEYAEVLGMDFKLSHPRNMMYHTVFPIPGMQLRPPNSSGIKGEDLTHRYRLIVTCARKLAAARYSEVSFAGTASVDSTENALYLNLAESIAGVVDPRLHAKSSRRVFGTPKDTLFDRINGPKSKESALRGRTIAKRICNTARCVIVPDPDLTIDQVGVPEAHAEIILIPETVTSWNLSQMYSKVRSGAARFLQSDEGQTRVDLSCVDPNTVVLHPGQVIERKLQNGDTAVFVRQPALHKYSTMALQVVLQPGNVLAMNPCLCPSYNADYDGDEMNLFFIVSTVALIEGLTLMRPSQNILKNGTPIIRFVQHTLVSLYAIGFEESLSYDHVSRWFEAPCPRKTYTGREAFSLLLPKGQTVIRNGQWLTGLIDASVVNGRDGIIATMVFDLGSSVAAKFIFDASRFLTHYCDYRGYSFGISDYTFPREPPTNEEERMKLAASIRKQAEHRDNNMLLIVRSGAKGSEHNFAQLSGALGQTCSSVAAFIDLKAVPNEGFVSSCFSEGLNARDAFTHLMGASYGMASTACATPKSGYISKKLVQGLKSLSTQTDYSVRDVDGRVVQVIYGGDGFDPNRISSVPIDLSVKGLCEAESEYLESLAVEMRRLPPEWTRDVLLPVNFPRLVFKWTKEPSSAETPLELFTRARKWFDAIHVPKPLKTRWGVAQWTRSEILATVDVDKYLADAERLLYRGLVEYGEPVGIIASQDMGEATTQSTLNEFRQKSTANTGLPRLSEILDASYSSSSTIHITAALKDGVNPYDFIRDVVHVRLRDLCDRIQGTRVILRRQACQEVMITPAEIASHLPDVTDCSLWDDPGEPFITITPANLSKSVDQFCNIVVDSASIIGELEKVMPATAIFEAVRRNTITVQIPCLDSEHDVQTLLEACENLSVTVKITHKFVDESGTTLTKAKNLTCTSLAPPGANLVITVKFMAGSASEKWLTENPELVDQICRVHIDGQLDVTVRGLAGIHEGVVDNDGRVILSCSWKTLEKVMLHPMVNPRLTTCNNACEVESFLGIISARDTIVRELALVFGHSLTGINIRHVELLADQMCAKGHVMAFNFGGFGDSNQTFTARATYERPADVFTDAAAIGAVDLCSGPVESMVVNTVPKFGTGAVTLYDLPQTTAPCYPPPPIKFPPPCRHSDISSFLMPKSFTAARKWESVYSFVKSGSLFEPFQ
jgi:DNA-directed RNA polymerase subunit A'